MRILFGLVLFLWLAGVCVADLLPDDKALQLAMILIFCFPFLVIFWFLSFSR